MRLMRLAGIVMIVLVIATVLTLEQGGGAPEHVVNQVDSALQVAKQAVQQAQNATQHTN
jgi:succinate dehydrogenase hydrophobic anchor subunit